MIMRLKLAKGIVKADNGFSYKQIDIYALHPTALVKENEMYKPQTDAVCICDGESEIVNFDLLAKYIRAGYYEIAP